MTTLTGTAGAAPGRAREHPARLTGTATLTRLAFRRDRIVLPAWIIGLSALLTSFTAMFVAGMPEQRDVVQEAQLMAGNPGLRMIGLASGATIGGITLIRGYVTLAVLTALMSVFAVVRHTRQSEETGRAELIGATVVGRYAGLASAVVVAVTANLVLVVAMALAMIVNGQPVPGSLAAGASFGAVGIAFAGVAAVTAQLSSTTRGANGFAAAAVGVAFLVAGAGNMLGHVDATGVRVRSAWPVWLSPIGWGQQMRPFDHPRWWTLVPFVLLCAALLGAAALLAGRRDVGRGILAGRPGNAEASPRLLSPFGLVWRLQRGMLTGWLTGAAGFGLIFGSITDQADHAEGAALDWYRQMGAGTADQLTDAFRATVIEMAGLAAAIYMVQILLRMRSEEADGPLEPVLATPVTRPRWVMSHVANACLGAIGILLAASVGMALTGAMSTGDLPGRLRELTAAALAQLPAALVVGGVVVVTVGALPRWAGAVSWTALMLAIVFGPVFGTSLRLPDRVLDLSPFTHVPFAPANDIMLAPLALLTVVAVVLCAAGLLSARRRDLVLPA